MDTQNQIYLAYLTFAPYKHHLGTNGWDGVQKSLDELGSEKQPLSWEGRRITKLMFSRTNKERILKNRI